MNTNTLINQLLTGILVLDEHFTIRYVNSAAESLLDHSAKRLLGEPFSTAFFQCSLASETIANCFQYEQRVLNTDVEFTLHSGHRITVDVCIQTIQDSGQTQLLMELRKADQLRRINQEDQQRNQLFATQHLLRGMAHEIKNPLGGLRGAAQLLARELNDDYLKEYTDLIISQSDRLRFLVDRLLGPMKPGKREWVNIHEITERVAKTLFYEYGDSLKITRDYDPSLPDIMIVEESCEQVFLNIAQNAAQAMNGNGKLTLRTRVEHQMTLFGERYRQCAVVHFIDTGPGISDALRDTLFYPLVSGRAEGTGLGLSLAQTIVHQHKGKIEVNSEPGRTQFSVYLPYVSEGSGND